MKKKLLVSITIFFSILLLVGCSKKEEDTISKQKNIQKKDTTINEQEEIELYSDKNKLVFENGKTKLVYYYKDDKITGYETYIDYDNKENANIAKETMELDDRIKKVYTKGKYLVVEYNESEYSSMTLKELKIINSLLKEIKEEES